MEGQLATVGNWRLLNAIGQGSYAQVYKAKDTNTGALAAVKAVRDSDVQQRQLRESLKSEIAILTQVRHPNIVKLYGYEFREHDPFGQPVPTHYLILEYCNGGDMAQYLENRKRSGSKGIDEGTAQRLLRMIALGLKEMHRHKVMHRDLKPGNILLTEGQLSVKIADFGFAKALHQADMARTMCGSPLYMAPEVLNQQGPYDSKADLWSVGVLLFEMLVGQGPFSGNTIEHLKKVIEANEPFLPFNLQQQLSAPCQDLLKKLLQKNPADRLSFDRFFTHAFLSGKPPRSLLGLPGQIVLEEVDMFDNDYVLLSRADTRGSLRPQRPAAPASFASSQPHAGRGASESRSLHGGASASRSGSDTGDTFDARFAACLPTSLTEAEALYAAAYCVSEIVDWKLVNSQTAAALQLSVLAAELLDEVLSRVLQPAPSTNAASDGDGCPRRAELDTRSQSGTAAPRNADPFAREHSSESRLDDDPGLYDVSLTCDADRPAPSGGQGALALDVPGVMGDGGAGPACEAWASRWQELCSTRSCEHPVLGQHAFRRLHAVVHKAAQLAGQLDKQQASVAPSLVQLVWQGMLSFASSAALDEMFGTYEQASQYYARSATLIWLLRRRGRPRSAAQHAADAPASSKISWVLDQGQYEALQEYLLAVHRRHNVCTMHS